MGSPKPIRFFSSNNSSKTWFRHSMWLGKTVIVAGKKTPERCQTHHPKLTRDMFNLQKSWRQTPSQKKKCHVFQVTSVYFQCLGELKHVFGLNRRRNDMRNTLHRNRKLKQVSSPCFCQQRRLSNDMETSQKRMINQRNRFSSFNYLVLSDFSEILIHQPQTPS